MRGIGHCRDQAWVDHRGADPEQQAANEPIAECRRGGGQKQARRLYPHSADDQAFAAPTVAQGTCCNLQDAPGRGIDRLENADALDSEFERGEEQREDTPAHAVIEIIDEARLRDAANRLRSRNEVSVKISQNPIVSAACAWPATSVRT
jgi:hypothetical protein